MRGLSASIDGLKGSSGTIPAAAVRIGYGMPWGDPLQTNPDNNEIFPYPAQPRSLLALDDVAPKEVPVQTGAVTPRSLKEAGQVATVFGAVVPVWVTVKVPADGGTARRRAGI